MVDAVQYERPGLLPIHFPNAFAEVDAAAHFRQLTSHSFTVWSLLAEASVLPSGLHATDHTSPVCPLRVANSLPVAAPHSFAVWSLPAEARVLPSGLHVTEFTAFVCPLRVASSL